MNSSRNKWPKCSQDDVDIDNIIYFWMTNMQSFECANIIKIAINILGIHNLIIIYVPMWLCGLCWYGFRLGLVIQATFVAYKGNGKLTNTLFPYLIPFAHQKGLVTIFLKHTKGMNMTLVCHVNTLRPTQNGCHFQTTFSNAFYLMKMYGFQLRFHWSLFLRVRSTIFQHCFR